MYSRETEIRHISSADVFKLGQILEQTNSWKKLMRIIPKNLSDKLEENNIKKYNNDHVRLIENASLKQNRMSTEILFEEWGTSGRKRPTVGNLLELLITAELFRAADFVAKNFLNEPLPERPLRGPAAKVDISLPLLPEDINEIEKILDDSNYPGTRTLLENAQIQSEMNNKDFYEKVTFGGKKLIESSKIMTKTTSQSDLIKFLSENIENTTNTIENNIPILSDGSYTSSAYATNTQLIEFSSKSSTAPESPQLMINESSSKSANNLIDETNIDDGEFESKNIPILSVLQTTQHKNEGDYNLQFNGINENFINNDDSNYRSNDSDDNDADDFLSNDSSTNNSSASNDSNILTPNLSLFGGSMNDSSLTNVTETSDDSSFSCDTASGKSIQSDSNIPCISALNN